MSNTSRSEGDDAITGDDDDARRAGTGGATGEVEAGVGMAGDVEGESGVGMAGDVEGESGVGMAGDVEGEAGVGMAGDVEDEEAWRAGAGDAGAGWAGDAGCLGRGDEAEGVVGSGGTNDMRAPFGVPVGALPATYVTWTLGGWGESTRPG
jgi:hypothetical protein